ncbi:hypothetical protein BGZ51_006757 [Haplosporangium sp. Z 767]|nr:hypothetical protein BGZ51_006757 [Haplosporangium sp. Z 767]
MFHPTRGGTRGGQDQFKWEDVKEDKHRENYLGNSLLAPVGRWQKGRDLTWYAKAGDSDSNLASIQAKKNAEIQSIKDAEAEAMAEALGYKTKRKTETAVTEKELKTAISKTDSGEQDELGEKLKESSTIQGLGFKSRRQGMFAATGSTPVPSKLAPVPLIPESAQIRLSREKDMDDNPRAASKDTSADGSRTQHRRQRVSRSASPSRKYRHDHRRSDSRERKRGRDDRKLSSKRSHQGRDRSKSRSRSRNRNRSRSRERRRHGNDDERSHHTSRRYRAKDGEHSWHEEGGTRRKSNRSRSPGRSHEKQHRY